MCYFHYITTLLCKLFTQKLNILNFLKAVCVVACLAESDGILLLRTSLTYIMLYNSMHISMFHSCAHSKVSQ